jgi:acetyl/propionyl-CoA carboxylase alpha subunit
VFIGPPESAIRSMGSKRESKEIMTGKRVLSTTQSSAEDMISCWRTMCAVSDTFTSTSTGFAMADNRI